eukprot:TRINITY_DN49911_c0_g1_i2.p2 TRINITY_DN49911_c0_g1~~TRINITY_DN49911_c0_g1_i2.p2  ORF type:complete len:112 (-),score=26.63 TRINITY_DN49911_c0_g1_i2:40-375(-)
MCIRDRNNTERDYVNTTWVQTDGSAGFDQPPGSNLFEWHLDNEGVPVRMRLPSTLAADLMVDITDYKPTAPLVDTSLPEACLHPNAQQWVHGPVTPLAHKFATMAKLGREQ